MDSAMSVHRHSAGSASPEAGRPSRLTEPSGSDRSF